METKRKALGKGLEQLFSNERIDFNNFEKEIVSNTKENDIVNIPIDKIRSNPYQPRKHFDETLLKELADSIKEHGVVQPIIVKKSINGYELIAGERRTRASKLAGKETVPAIIRDFNDQEMMEIALIENIQRENLNPIEEAKAYENIISSTGMTQEELSIKFGKSRSYITNIIGLLKLPDSVKKEVVDGNISMGHARVLSKMDDELKINELAKEIISKHLSVRDIEKLASETNLPKKNQEKKEVNYKINIYEKAICEKIGNQVHIRKNKIEISFNSEKDLERILEILNIEIEGE